ncbi:MAG: hypothetical protein HUU37_11510 [Bdellovibrionales bacterium]|nr:hypothetical protein [Bdellovibrionales bacterium]
MRVVFSGILAVLLAAPLAMAAQKELEKKTVTAGGSRFEFRVVEEAREQRYLRRGKAGTVVLREASVLEGVNELRTVALRGLPSPMVLSRWRKGVHGEALTLHDVSSSTPVFELKSAWPMEVEVKPDRIEVLYTEEIQKDGQVPRYRLVWTGPGREPQREAAPLIPEE